jgi:hypothetical protein
MTNQTSLPELDPGSGLGQLPSRRFFMLPKEEREPRYCAAQFHVAVQQTPHYVSISRVTPAFQADVALGQ